MPQNTMLLSKSIEMHGTLFRLFGVFLNVGFNPPGKL